MSEFDYSLAVVIGINDYQNDIDPLRTAVPDAIAIAEILRDTYNYDEVFLRLNKDATKPNIKDLLTKILLDKINLQKIKDKKCRLVFYFAGHGLSRDSVDEPQGFLALQDADRKKEDSLLRMSDVHDWLAALECNHLLIILDCCFAGAFRWSSYRHLTPVSAKITKAHYDRFIRFRAWQVLTSASDNQGALEFINNRDTGKDKEGLDHSPFADGLIKALKNDEADLNGDGVIIAIELYQYLRDHVEIKQNLNLLKKVTKPRKKIREIFAMSLSVLFLCYQLYL